MNGELSPSAFEAAVAPCWELSFEDKASTSDATTPLDAGAPALSAAASLGATLAVEVPFVRGGCSACSPSNPTGAEFFTLTPPPDEPREPRGGSFQSEPCLPRTGLFPHRDSALQPASTSRVWPPHPARPPANVTNRPTLATWPLHQATLLKCPVAWVPHTETTELGRTPDAQHILSGGALHPRLTALRPSWRSTVGCDRCRGNRGNSSRRGPGVGGW